jgi:ABC-type antimicrobial peptide transport system permease subunit
MREAGGLIVLGLAIGLIAAWWLGRYVQNQLYAVTPADPLTVLAASATLTIVAGMASLLPARRAARLTPMSALREE